MGAVWATARRRACLGRLAGANAGGNYCGGAGRQGGTDHTVCAWHSRTHCRSLKRRLFETPNGFYPWFGSVYSGGGFTVGGGYRQYYGDQSSWSACGLLSAKSYKLAELVTDGIGLGPINLQAIGGWRDATQVAFYGVGGDTAPEQSQIFR